MTGNRADAGGGRGQTSAKNTSWEAVRNFYEGMSL